MQGKNWIFTSNNYTPDEVSALQRFGAANEGFVYLVFGYETVPNTGTPHLQGFLVLSERKRHISSLSEHGSRLPEALQLKQ
jgi:hypothetical protein